MTIDDKSRINISEQWDMKLTDMCLKQMIQTIIAIIHYLNMSNCQNLQKERSASQNN